ncbi:extracellular solute-binding protein [bacterium]|nr:extracellular solute-binding protein [bacterium]
MSKKLFGITLLLVLFISSCKPSAPVEVSVTEIVATEEIATEAPIVETPIDASVTLTIFILDYTGETIEWLEKTINPAFENEHPGVAVEIVKGSWSDWQGQYDEFFLANAGPDIINLGPVMDVQYIATLADLEPFLGESVWPEIKNFGPALDSTRYEGKIRGLPIFTAPRYVFCRKDLMEAAGWMTGTPKNFAEWIDFARKASQINTSTNSLTQQALVPVDADSMADWQWWLLVFNSLGGKLYKEDGTPNFNSPEALAASQFLLDMRLATYGLPADAVASLSAGQGSVIDINDETGEDNGAVCLAHSGWAAPALDRAIWENVSIDAFSGDPANFPNSKPVVLAFNDWLAVPEYSQNKELAAEWLKMAFSKDANNKWNETIGMIPARKDSQFGYIAESVQLKREAELANQFGVGFAFIKEPARLAEIMQVYLEKLVFGELSPTQANDAIQTEYLTVLSRSR